MEGGPRLDRRRAHDSDDEGVTAQVCAGYPRPDVTLHSAAAWAGEIFGVAGDVSELGSQQDRNFIIDSALGRRLLKVNNSACSPAEAQAQHAVMRAVGRLGLAVPRPFPTVNGAELEVVGSDEERHVVRLLSFVEGSPLNDWDYLHDGVLSQMGHTVGRISAELATVEHEGLRRDTQWDLRRGTAVADGLLSHVRAQSRRARVAEVLPGIRRRLEGVSAGLPVQALHGDLTDDNLVARREASGQPLITGVIDFGDASYGWRVAELAIACSAVLHHRPEDPFAVLPLIAGFDAEVRLDDAEIEALWPLLTLRGATLVVSGEQQIPIDATNDYAREALEREWHMFAKPASVDCAVATAVIRQHLGRTVERPRRRAAESMLMGDDREVELVSLDCDADDFAPGGWLNGRAEEVRILKAAARRSGVAATRFAEPRLTMVTPIECAPPTNVAISIDVAVESAQALMAPFDADVQVREGVVALKGRQTTVFLQGVEPLCVSSVPAGEPVAVAPDLFRLWWVNGDCGEPPPAFVRPVELAGWQGSVFDPAPLLGHAATGRRQPSSEATLLRRRRSYCELQSHYYDAPPQIERGWREFLIDVHGRHYVDMVNNVTVLGHGHPRIAQAAADQWSRLNTNSRFNYAVVADFTERLLKTLPDSFDTVLLVNSGTEAIDLALRLTAAFTGRRDVMCVAESYHGWSAAADAVSTSVSDNPRAAETRPSWVHVADAPNAYRGTHRGASAGAAYAADAISLLKASADAGRPVGAFIAEPRNGNAGAIEVPPGYLAAVYSAVRAGGGVCISDEVQVGYGRQGDCFWGYMQHDGVVPDVITMAKAMGNGHPIGAVITRQEIAAALADQGTFFSSAGGSTLSSRIGLTVLDVIESEHLQLHAAEMGAYLRESLERLAARHPLVGAIHGRGLYLGLELVRDPVTLEPAAEETAAICSRLLELGVIVQPTGDRQNVLKIKPPLCIARASLDHFVEALDIALTCGW